MENFIIKQKHTLTNQFKEAQSQKALMLLEDVERAEKRRVLDETINQIKGAFYLIESVEKEMQKKEEEVKE